MNDIAIRGLVHRDFSSVVDVFRRFLPAHDGGAALAIFHRGELVVDVAAGTRDESGAPFLSDTVALSFSTTKGVTSTLLHVLASQGRIAYEAPVARYWPEFGQNGKAWITVRDLLAHAAGLSSIRALVDDAREMLDFQHMLRCLEEAQAVRDPAARPAYHALTYGALVGGLIEKVAGRPFAEVLRDELAAPLGLDGCFVGIPPEELPRRAFIFGEPNPLPEASRADEWRRHIEAALGNGALLLAGGDPPTFEDAVMPTGILRLDWNDAATSTACIPSVGGCFNARSLARIYAMIANDGELDGARLLSRETACAAGAVQSAAHDRVLGLRMGWRLGYHSIPALMDDFAFGHFGFGGSGAMCDPSRQLAVALVVNQGTTTAVGNTRAWWMAAAALRAADRRRR